MTVSGVVSMRSIKSGFSANAGPLSRVTVIIYPSLDLVLMAAPRPCRDSYRHRHPAGSVKTDQTVLTQRELRVRLTAVLPRQVDRGPTASG